MVSSVEVHAMIEKDAAEGGISAKVGNKDGMETYQE